MSLLDEFKWKKYATIRTCMICKEVKAGWYLMTKVGGICIICAASITTMHNLKEDEVK